MEQYFDIAIYLLKQIPIAVAAVILTLVFLSIRSLHKKVERMGKTMVTKCDFNDLKTDVESLKEEKVWSDVFKEVIKAIKERLNRIESRLNGMRK